VEKFTADDLRASIADCPLPLVGRLHHLRIWLHQLRIFHSPFEGCLGSFFAWYYSGVTFLTLGFGDIAPVDTAGRIWRSSRRAQALFSLPASSRSFRHVRCCAKARIPIVLLDSKAGSNPTGFDLLLRHATAGTMHILPAFLEKYEQWGAEMLEGVSFLSGDLVFTEASTTPRTGLRLRRRFLTPVRSLRLAMRPTTSSPGI